MKKTDSTLLNLISKGEIPNIYFYGATEMARLACVGLKTVQLEPSGIFDQLFTSSTTYSGITAYTKDEIHSLDKSSYFFITCTYLPSISNYLKQLGFKNVYDCAYLLKLALQTNLSNADRIACEMNYDALDSTVDIFLRKYNEDLIINSMDMVVTERCTLRCNDCANLMPYFNKPINADLNLLLNSLRNIMSLATRVNELRVLGGEPFLHREAHKIIKSCCSYDNVNRVIVYTNATVLPKPCHLESLKHPKIRVYVTDYGPLSRKLLEMVESFNREKIQYIVDPLPESWDDSANICKDDRTDEENQHLFNNCCSKYLYSLLHGKLYRCPFSSSINALKIITSDPGDYLDVSGASNFSVADLFNFVTSTNYVPSCKFCQGRGKVDGLFKQVSPGRQIKGTRKPSGFLERVERV